jgi:small subunit ribosomal protein S13e
LELPHLSSIPTWLKLTWKEAKEQIYKLAKKNLTRSQEAQLHFVTSNKNLENL